MCSLLDFLGVEASELVSSKCMAWWRAVAHATHATLKGRGATRMVGGRVMEGAEGTNWKKETVAAMVGVVAGGGAVSHSGRRELQDIDRY